MALQWSMVPTSFFEYISPFLDRLTQAQVKLWRATCWPQVPSHSSIPHSLSHSHISITFPSTCQFDAAQESGILVYKLHFGMGRREVPKDSLAYAQPKCTGVTSWRIKKQRLLAMLQLLVYGVSPGHLLVVTADYIHMPIWCTDRHGLANFYGNIYLSMFLMLSCYC